MGLICSSDHDALATAYADFFREDDRLRDALAAQEVEITAQQGRLQALPQTARERAEREEDITGGLGRAMDQCFAIRNALEEIRQSAEARKFDLSALKSQQLSHKESLRKLHAQLKHFRKTIKSLSNQYCEDSARRVVTEGEYESKIEELEQKLRDKEKEIEELQVEKHERRLSSVQLSRHYSDISSDSEFDPRSPGLLEPPKDNRKLSHQVSELQVDLSRLATYNQKLLKEKILLMFCSAIHMSMVRAIHLWRHITRPRLSSHCSSSLADHSFQDSEDLVAHSPRYSIEKSNAKSMSSTNVVILFESVMDDKREQDCRDLVAGRKPKSPGEFLVEYMNRRHGLATLAMTKLTQFATGVARMQRSGSLYAKLMSGLLGFGEEMHLSLSLYLPHARWQFLELKERRRRGERARTVFSPATPPQREKPDDIDSGGSALLVAVCDLVYTLCKNFPQSGEMLLRFIRPQEVSVQDFVILKVCQKMAQAGYSPEDMFRLLDRDDSGTITCSEFENGLRSLMGMWLSPSDLRTAMEKISNGSEEVSRTAFFTYINFDVYFNSDSGKSLIVTCCTFLIAMQKLYEKLVQNCRDAFPQFCKCEEMQQSEFSSALNFLDPSLAPADIEDLFARAEGPMDIDGFCELCQNEYVGQLKLFGNT